MSGLTKVIVMVEADCEDFIRSMFRCSMAVNELKESWRQFKNVLQPRPWWHELWNEILGGLDEES